MKLPSGFLGSVRTSCPMLGLVPLDPFVLGLVAVSLAVTVVGAEFWSRRAARRGDSI